MRIGIVCVLLGGLLAATNAAAECKFTKLGDFPVTVRGNRMIVQATVGGHDFPMIVDSGAGITMIDAAVAKAAGLALHPARGMRVSGVGGETRADWALMRDLKIGGVPFPERQFLVNSSGAGVSLLGYDFLSLFDVEIDVKNSRLGLFKTEGCSNTNMAYWAPDRADEVDIVSPGTPQVTVRIDGQPATATVDTGASSTIVAKRFAAFLGVEATEDARKRTSRGVDNRTLDGFYHTFKSFEVGDEKIANPTLGVVDGLKNGFGFSDSRLTQSAGHGDMLLGFDFFRSHRVFLSRTDKKMFFTYEGGPVFAPSQPASK